MSTNLIKKNIQVKAAMLPINKFPVLNPRSILKDALDLMCKNKFGSVCIVDNNKKLIGYCPLNKLLVSEDNLSVGKIMQQEDIKSIPPDANWREVATLMSKYNLINIPVTNMQSNELLGIISVDDVLPWLLDERN